MVQQPPRYTRPDPLFPYTTRFRSLPPLAERIPVHSLLSVSDSRACQRQPQIPRESIHRTGRRGARAADATDGSSRVAPPGASWGATLDEPRSEEHTSELQSLMRLSYAVFCSNKQHNTCTYTH